MKSVLSLIALVASLVFPSPAFAQGSASFSWSQNAVSVSQNGEVNVTLSLSTAGSRTTGADALLTYDPTRVEVVNVAFANPNLYSLNFNKTSAQSSTVSLTSTFTDVAGNFAGTGAYATLTLKGLVPGSSTLNWDCRSGETKDSNILLQGTGADILNCSSLHSLTVTVTQAASTSTETTATPTTTNTAVGTSTSTCTALQSSPTGLSVKAQSATSVLLTWTKESNASYYTLKYGTAAGSYQYGAANIGNSGSFLVSALRPNTTYYFAIAGVNACSTSAYITASGKTKSTGTAAAPVAPNTPSFTTLVTQVNQTQPAPVIPAPVQDERLATSNSPALEKENFLAPTQAKAKSLSASFVSPVMIAGGVVVLVILIGVGVFFALRKPPVTPTVTTVVESPVSPPIPPLGG